LKKKVTWAYFSVSAIRSCLSPRDERTSPRVIRGCTVSKATGKGKFSWYLVKVVKLASAGLTGRSNAVNPTSVRTLEISRPRSARKLKKMPESPSRHIP
jgi:hypothetical protein